MDHGERTPTPQAAAAEVSGISAIGPAGVSMRKGWDLGVIPGHSARMRSRIGRPAISSCQT